ncbi:MAG: AAA family ATPase [Proteobacteria bacterium]|nr:AAA family ATPase [Pseudomonadota bacterium]
MTDIGGERAYRPENAFAAKDFYVVLSGCSGGGKSSLLHELGRRGYRIFEEPGRQIIKEQNAIGGDAVPEGNVRAFAEILVSRSINRMIEAAGTKDFVFFDRGLVDVVSWYEYAKQDVPAHFEKAAQQYRYRTKVFLVPPWTEIFENDAERKHSLAEALAQYEVLPKTYTRLGYAPVMVPKASIVDRADFVLHELDAL